MVETSDEIANGWTQQTSGLTLPQKRIDTRTCKLMQIEEDFKLDFKNVLIRPKRSTLKSRKDVDLVRKTKFRNSKRTYIGVPIMGANMDGVGTFEMSDALSNLALFSCLVKTYSVNELVSYFDVDDEELKEMRTEGVAMSIGASDQDYEKFRNVYELTDGTVKYLCVDVANGYTEMFSNFIYQLRLNHPELVIIAGNVVTGDMTQELILNGADIVKCGIRFLTVCVLLVFKLVLGILSYRLLLSVLMLLMVWVVISSLTVVAQVQEISKGTFGGGADFVMLGGMNLRSR